MIWFNDYKKLLQFINNFIFSKIVKGQINLRWVELMAEAIVREYRI